MKLPFALPFKKQVKIEYFLALILHDEKISAVVFEEIEGKIKVIGEGTEFFTDSIDTITYDAFLELVDKSIGKAESNLPKGVETEKTIFGVKADWVHESQIKKEHLIILKKICDELGLSPIGFLVIPEAVSHLLSKEEGAPISGLLTEVGKKSITISIVRAGRVLETKKARIEDSIPKTTDRILHHFTNHEILPSRIIVFDSNQEDDLQQQFISFSWSKSLPFLHVPQITILPKRFEAKSILFGAATQMGFDLLSGEDLTLQLQKNTHHDSIKSAEKEESIEGKTYEALDIAAEENKETGANEFGFIVNGDIEKKEAAEEKESPNESKKTKGQEPPNESSFEIKDGENFTVPVHAFEEENVDNKQYEGEEEEIHESKYKSDKKQTSVNNVLSSFMSSLPLSPISSFLNRGKLPSISSIPIIPGNKKIVIFLGVVLLLCIGGYLAYSSFVSATVTIIVNPKQIEETKTITFSPEGSSDYENNLIAAETTRVEQEGSASTSTTGKKEVGEKAKGSITILSSLTKEQTLAEGTTITSSNGLTFTLDKSIKIASSSGLSDIKSIGASVTAKDIGKESNLPSGTKFSVSTFDRSSVEAKNDSAFSGGTKKEVTVVSKKDQDKLAEELPKKLEEEVKAKIGGTISEDKELLPNYFTTSLTGKTYDKKIDEEAKSVSLQATVAYEGLAYTKSDLLQLFKSYFEKDSQLSLSEKSISYDITKLEKGKNGDVSAAMNIKASLLPKIDSDSLSSKLAGLSFDQAIEEINKTSQIADVQITHSPSLPFLPKILPRNEKNIKINIQINE